MAQEDIEQASERVDDAMLADGELDDPAMTGMFKPDPAPEVDAAAVDDPAMTGLFSSEQVTDALAAESRADEVPTDDPAVTSVFKAISEDDLEAAEAPEDEVLLGKHSIVKTQADAEVAVDGDAAADSSADEPAEADETEANDAEASEADEAAEADEAGDEAEADAVDDADDLDDAEAGDEAEADAGDEAEAEAPAAGELAKSDDADDETALLPVIGPDAEDAAAAQDAGKKKRRGLKALLIAAAVVVVLLGGAVAALAVDDGNRTQKVPEGTVLDDTVDVSGMTAQELEDTIIARVNNGYAAKVQLKLDKKTYEIDLAKVGSVDTEPTVKAAFAPYDKGTIERYADRVAELLGNKTETHNIVTMMTPSAKKLKKAVKKIAKKVDTPAVNAGYYYADGKLKTTKSKTGLKVDVQKTVAALQAGLEGKSTGTVDVEGTVDETKPEKTEAGQAIYINTSSCQLYLYENGKVKVQYACSPGRAGYSTPTGDFYLLYKDGAPTWTNPHSDWSKSMPESIPPGASNPLGLRALAVSCGGGIFIHGTTNVGALGTRDSHGCIRLSNANILSLYDMVSTGIPIIIR